jgi:hypothetical protein
MDSWRRLVNVRVNATQPQPVGHTLRRVAGRVPAPGLRAIADDDQDDEGPR